MRLGLKRFSQSTKSKREIQLISAADLDGKAMAAGTAYFRLLQDTDLLPKVIHNSPYNTTLDTLSDESDGASMLTQQKKKYKRATNTNCSGMGAGSAHLIWVSQPSGYMCIW